MREHKVKKRFPVREIINDSSMGRQNHVRN
jgi:hypothetical protein